MWDITPKAIIILIIASATFAPKQSSAQGYTLDECKKLALDNNYKIKIAANEVQQAEQVKKQAFTNYFPTVTAGATAVKFNGNMISTDASGLPVFNGDPATLATASQFAYIPAINTLDYMNVANIMAIQPIFAGLQVQNGNKLAKVGYEVSTYKQSMTTSEVLVHTEELYWTVLGLEAKLRTLDNYSQLLDTLARDVNAAYNAGLVQRSDVLKVQLKSNELKVNRMRLTNGIALSRSALCQHIGIASDSLQELTSVADISAIAVQNVNTAEAVSARNEYKMLQQGVTAAELQRKMAMGACMPTIAIGAAGLYNDVADQTIKKGLVMATVSIPLSDWWGGSHKIAEQKIKVQAAQSQLAESTELLQLQISQAQNELNEQLYQLSIDSLSVEQAKENLKVTDDNYRAGVVGMSDLLEAQSAHQAAMNSYTEAQYNCLIKRAKYLQTTNTYQ